MHNIFVYGSLKRGFHNHWQLEESTFFDTALTLRKEWLMFSMGSYPALVRVPNGAGDVITGEIYKVNDETFKRLDRLEWYPHHYSREKVLILSDNGYLMECWVYYQPDSDYIREYPQVCGGTWTYNYSESDQ